MNTNVLWIQLLLLAAIALGILIDEVARRPRRVAVAKATDAQKGRNRPLDMQLLSIWIDSIERL